MFAKFTSFKCVLFASFSWRLVCSADVTSVTFTEIQLTDSSGLVATESVMQRNAPNCINWCNHKYKSLCNAVLFDSERRECQKVTGEVTVGQSEPSTKSVFIRHNERKKRQT